MRDLRLSSTTYDLAGRAVAVTDANGRVTRTTYDGADRVLSVVRQGYVADPRGASSAPPARDVVIERHEYDKAGNETRVVQGTPGGPDIHAEWAPVGSGV